jgi:hypothetical protein
MATRGDPAEPLRTDPRPEGLRSVACAAQHDANGLQDDGEVGLQRLHPKVEIVEAHAVGRTRSRCAWTPATGRSDRGAAVVGAAGIECALVDHDRARADEAHVAEGHVEELRQFIERRLAQDGAQGGDAGIVLQLLGGVPFDARAWGLAARCASSRASASTTMVRSFHRRKCLAVTTDTQLAVERCLTLDDPDGQGGHTDQRQPEGRRQGQKERDPGPACPRSVGRRRAAIEAATGVTWGRCRGKVRGRSGHETQSS